MQMKHRTKSQLVRGVIALLVVGLVYTRMRTHDPIEHHAAVTSKSVRAHMTIAERDDPHKLAELPISRRRFSAQEHSSQAYEDHFSVKEMPPDLSRPRVANVLSVTPFKIDVSAEKYPTIADATGKSEGTFEDNFSWKLLRDANPRVFRLYNTLSVEDCQSIIDVAEKKITRSQVVTHNENNRVNQIRTSHGMFIDGHDAYLPANIKLRRRVAMALGVPVENVEATQVLRYLPGQFYKAHPDYFYREFPEHLARGGQRFGTVLTWLNDVQVGGHTKFPTCSLEAKPDRGGSVMFYSMDKNGVEDPGSFHEAVPPGEGSIKWVAVAWVRQHAFR